MERNGFEKSTDSVRKTVKKGQSSSDHNRNSAQFCTSLRALFTQNGLVTLSLCLIKFAVGLFVSAINSVIAPHMNSLKISSLLLGISLSSFYISSFLTSVLFGYFSEWSQFGRVAVSSFGLCSIGAVGVGMGFAGNWYSFLPLFVVSGVSYSAIMNCVYSLVMDIYPGTIVIFALTAVEFSEALSWMISTSLLLQMKKINILKNPMTFSFLVFGCFLITLSIMTGIPLYIKTKNLKNEFKNKSKNLKNGGNNYSLKERFKKIFIKREFWVSMLAITVSCACYYNTATVFAIYLKNDKFVTIFHSIPSSLLACLAAPLIAKKVDKEKFICFSLLFLSPFYVFLADSPFDKRDLDEGVYVFLNVVLILSRDFVYTAAFVLSNNLLMEKIAGEEMKEFELNGLCEGFFIFAVTLGDTFGTIFGTALFENFEFSGLSYASAVFSFFGFGVCFLILVRWKINK